MIEHIEEMRLTHADEQSINALINSAFGPHYGPRSFHGQRHHMRLIIRDPHIIGHMALCYRAIRLDGRLINVIGLAEVATDPGRRGEGIAARLLQAAIAESKASQAAFILLFGSTSSPYWH
ncbi:MAG: GNAT family N-acetyltransferase [Rhodobacteraceae bacterium]|nr:GNAT family N-acetyltransferase [Paracoccaceae bacterium]